MAFSVPVYSRMCMDMNNISVLIKPASSLCNLRCRYCFYANEAENRDISSHGIMREETVKILTSRINEALEGKGTANISFQGGEPTTAGLDFFRTFVSSMQKYPGIQVQWSVQTNGTLLNEEWAEFFHEHHFLVGVSLDGYQKNMDQFRVDTRNKGVYWSVNKGIDCLKKAGVEYNILTVVTRQLAEHPKALFSFYKEHHYEYVQLIPCLPPLDGSDDGISLRSQDYESFFIEFFDAWDKDARKTGKPLNVNLFDNIMGMLQGYAPYQCGMLGRCSVQYVIESNGDVYPCDFYCLDEWKLGNLKDDSFAQLAEKNSAESFMKTSSCRKAPCSSCRYQNMCNGGCRRQNACYLTDEHCAYQKLLDHIVRAFG